MDQDNNHAEMCKAFAKAQSEFKEIDKNKTVSVRMKSGGTYEFAYADLAEILSKTRPALNKNHFSVTWNEEGELMVCTLLHPHGSIRSSMKVIGNANTPQEKGGLSTYYRRYTLSNCLGIASDEDTDASEQQGEFKVKNAKKKVAGKTSSTAPVKKGNASPKQINYLKSLYKTANQDRPKGLENFNFTEASKEIERLLNSPKGPSTVTDGKGSPDTGVPTITEKDIPF